MKKLRIALIVICSIILLFKLMDLVTEHNNKKEFLAQAEAFAQATSDGDYETANAYNKHPFEADLDSVDDNVKRMYEIIEGSMDYEIHTDKAVINNDVRRVDITFTMVDYKGIYETMSFPTMEEYITALENNPQRVLTVEAQYVGKRITGDNWEYRCNFYADVIDFYEFLKYAAWAPDAELTETFASALEASLPDYDEHALVANSDRYYYWDFTGEFVIFVFDTPEQAAATFAQYAAGISLVGTVSEGEYAFYSSDEAPMTIICSTDTITTRYCWIYLDGDKIIIASTDSTDQDNRDAVDRFIDYLGFEGDSNT